MRKTKPEVHMTKHLISIFMVAAAIPVFAADSHKLIASVPFNFTAGEVAFQAGDYQITRNGVVMVAIRSADRSKAAMVLTNSVVANAPSATGRLVFFRSGEQYFLSEVWEPGSSSGSALPPSSKERELRSRSGVPSRARVSVALR